jgi:hypothetical protein
MIQQLVQEEADAAADDDEHLRTISCLVRL